MVDFKDLENEKEEIQKSLDKTIIKINDIITKYIVSDKLDIVEIIIFLQLLNLISEKNLSEILDKFSEKEKEIQFIRNYLYKQTNFKNFKNGIE